MSIYISILIKIMHEYRELISNGKEQIAFLWWGHYLNSGV